MSYWRLFPFVSVDSLFVATPDDVIPQIACQVQWKQGQWVVHCSGADSREVLEPAKAMGAHTGVFHPLQSFAGGGDPSSKFQGITFALEGEGALLDTLRGFARDLGGDSIVLPAEDKVLYHASAVIVSNYLVTLMGMGTELWEKFDQPRNEAVKALLPLIKGTLENIEKVGLPDCLTGPIARGDETTIAKHLQALKARDENMLRAYCELGLQTIPIALAKGRINEAKARKLEALFHSAIKEEVKSYS